MSQTAIYSVPGIHCSGCKDRIERHVLAVVGVESANVDIDANQVTVLGEGVSDPEVRTAIREAGYEAE